MKVSRRVASLLLALLLCFPAVATLLVTGLSNANVSYYDGSYSTDWYYANPTPSNKEFHLKSAADLAGYVYLVNTVFGGASFGGYTIKLDCNVVWNEGNAADWIDTAPQYSWTPISISQAHYSSGGFDGQGHYISGLYQKDDGYNHTGFIGVHGGTNWGVKNLAIVNSFFCKTSSGGSQNSNYGVGVFMSTPYNSFTFENLYTDAIVMDSSNHTGGIVGNPRSSGATCTLNNCVFAGTIISGGSHVGGMVGTNNTRTVVMNDCLNLGSIYGKDCVGGLIGTANSAAATGVTANNCINAGPVKAAAGGTYGAILGKNSATHFTPVLNNCLAVDVATTTLAGGSAVNGSGSKSVTAASIFNQPTLNLSAYSSGFATGWVNHNGSYPLPKEISTMVKELGISLPTDENGLFKDKAGIDVAGYDPNQTQIVLSNAADLKRFAFLNQYLGATFAGQTVKLAADITWNEGNAADWAENPPAKSWTPINNFAGVFDGQGHAICGLYYKGSGNGALFASVNNATVRNLMVLNSYFESTGSVAGVVSNPKGNATRIESVYCDAILRANGHHNGGIVGVMGGSYLEIDSCVYAGSLYADMRYAGGILGNTNFNRVKITNCLNLGSIAAADELGGIVGIGGNQTGDVVANCINAGYVGSLTASYNGDIKSWYRHNENDLSNGGIYGTVKGNAPSETNLYKLTLDDCWLVTDFTPNRLSMRYEHSLTGEESLITLSELWGMDPKELDSASSLYGEYSFAEDWVKTANYPLPKSVEKMMREGGVSLKLDADGKTVQALDMTWNRGLAPVTLKSSSQMTMFSEVSAKDSLTWADKTVVLSNDITMSKDAFVASWTPLSDFAGTFDGKGHTVKGLQISVDTATAAMFASVNGATVKDLFLTEAALSSKRNASGLVWEVRGSSVIDNVYFDGVVTAGYSAAGGIVGIANAPVSIRRCVVDGEIKGSSDVGGILGSYGQNAVSLSDSLVLADVSGTGDNVGGLMGLASHGSSNQITAVRCVVVGTVSSTPARKQGALIGYLTQTLSGDVFSDCYAVNTSNTNLIYGKATANGAVFAEDSALKGFALPLNGWEIVFDSYPLPSAMIADKMSQTLAVLDAKGEKDVVGWLAGDFFLPDGFTFRYDQTPPQDLTPGSFETVKLGLQTEDASIRMEAPYGVGFFTRIDKATYDALAELGAIVKVGTLITPTDHLENGVEFDVDALTSAHGANAYLDVEKSEGWYNAATAAADGFYRYRGSIVNIKDQNADRPFSATGYVKLRYTNGTEALYYGVDAPKFHNGSAHLLATEGLQKPGITRPEQVIYASLKAKYGVSGMRFLGQYRDHFKVNGRTSALSEGITVDWSGSSLEFNLNCSGDVKISAIGSYATALGSGNTNFTVYVDGVATRTIRIYNGYNKDLVIATGLAAGEHHFRLAKWEHAEGAQVEFTKLVFDGELLARPADSEIYIEIIGDSISCGYGNNNGSNDGNLSYGYIAADILNADYSIFARSGLWLVNKGTPAIPDLYPYVNWYRDGGVPGGELYDFARIPDVVVINLGTNDYNGKAGADSFAAAMKSFVSQIREKYGNEVPIVWAYGMMNDGYKSTIQSVVAELGGAQTNNYALGFEQNNTGAGSHPDTAHQRQYGEELAAYIDNLLK